MRAAFIDIETNGLNFNLHVPLEIAVIGCDLNSTTPCFTYNTFIQCSKQDFESSQQDALKVNGITYEDVKDAPTYFQVMNEMEEKFKTHNIVRNKALLICQNPSFDRPFFHKIVPEDHMRNLNFPYHWLDLASMYWMKYYYDRSFIDELSLSKDAIAKSLELPEEIKPHRAYNGAKHLMDSYNSLRKSQLKSRR